ncbi:MAG: hypothetical protein FWH51_00735 [Dehalococcoidia bacterium]|nr:hypothetical protein [Dehalococcoidia bacterium]
MDEIKSARDIAQAKIERVGDITEADRLRWKYLPVGEQLAAKYLKEGHDLATELAAQPVGALPYIKKGLEAVLMAAVALPQNDTAQSRNQRALDGIIVIKHDLDAAQRLVGQIRQVLGHYTDQGEKQRKATRETLKVQYEGKLRQAMDKQLGGVGGLEDLKISVESLPQFQEEWRRVSAQLDQQYLGLLEEFKQELAKVG